MTAGPALPPSPVAITDKNASPVAAHVQCHEGDEQLRQHLCDDLSCTPVASNDDVVAQLLGVVLLGLQGLQVCVDIGTAWLSVRPRTATEHTVLRRAAADCFPDAECQAASGTIEIWYT
jgi:hypothetical protein